MASGGPSSPFWRPSCRDGSRKCPATAASCSWILPPLQHIMLQPLRSMVPRAADPLPARSFLITTALPQRPSGGPREAPRADLRSFHGANTPLAVMDLWRLRRSSSLDVLANVEALRALERCISTSSDARARAGDMLDLEDFVRDLLRQLHDRRNMLSFRLVADTLSCLLVVLPALGWPVLDSQIISNIAARLTPLAAESFKLGLVQMEELCSSFSTLALLADASCARRIGLATEVLQEAATYLQSGVFGTQSVLGQLEKANMAALAVAVEVIAKYDLAAPEMFLGSSMQRVDQLVEEALSQQTGEHRGDRDGRSRKGRARDGDSAASGSDGEPSDRGRGDNWTAAPDGGRGKSGLNAASTTEAAPGAGAEAPTDTSASYGLDMASLVRILVAWCSVNPGRPFPGASWLKRHAVLMLRTQDPSNAKRLEELQKQAKDIALKLDTKSRTLRTSLRSEKPNMQGRDDGVVGGSRQGGRGRGDGARGRDRGQDQRTAERMSATKTGGHEAAVSVEGMRRAIANLQAQQAEVTANLNEITASEAFLLRSSKPVQDADLVLLLAALASKLGDKEGRELGPLAEAVMEPRVAALRPTVLVQALAALANLGHMPSRPLLASALSALEPHITKLDLSYTLRLLDAWSRFGFTPVGRGQRAEERVLSAIFQAVDLNGGMSGTSTALLCELCRTSSRWDVPFDKKRLMALQEVVESRVLKSLPIASVKDLGKRAQVVVTRKDTMGGSAGSPSMSMSLEQLLHDILLPLARLRQGFEYPEMFTLAVGHWSDCGFEGLEEGTAALLLNAYAFTPAWPAVPALRARVVELLRESLGLSSVSAANLSTMFLAASRAMRMLAYKMQQLLAGTSIMGYTDPGVAVLVLPAVERVMQLNPSAQHIGRLAQGLFVELEWCGPSPIGTVTSVAGAQVPCLEARHEVAEVRNFEQDGAHMQTDALALVQSHSQGQIEETKRQQQMQKGQQEQTQQQETALAQAQLEPSKEGQVLKQALGQAPEQAQKSAKEVEQESSKVHRSAPTWTQAQELITRAQELTQTLASVKGLTGGTQTLDQALAMAQELDNVAEMLHAALHEEAQLQRARAEMPLQQYSSIQSAAVQQVPLDALSNQELKQQAQQQAALQQVQLDALSNQELKQLMPVPHSSQTKETHSDSVGPHVHGQALLMRMLDASYSSLSNCSLQGHAYLLAACNKMRHRPPPHWLVRLYKAAAVALVRRPTSVEVFVDLLNGISGIAASPSSDAEYARHGGSAGHVDKYADIREAEAPLLRAMAAILLKDPVLSALTPKPDTLARAVRQLAVRGLQPEPVWLDEYMVTVKGLLGSMSLPGLAHVAEGLALLRAAPPAEFLEILMVQAEKRIRSLSTYEPDQCGLLLGCAHALRQNALRAVHRADLQRQRKLLEEKQEEEDERGGRDRQWRLENELAQPLSKAALDAWGRTHVQLVTETRKGTGIRLFKPYQLALVVSAVAAYELTRPYASSNSNSRSSTKRGGSSGATASGDLIGRVTVDWLHDCVGGLLLSLSPRGLRTNNVFLPPPPLLIDLLRLTSCVLYGSRDGDIQDLRPPKGEASSHETEVKEAVVNYVRRAIGLLAQGPGPDSGLTGGFGYTSPVSLEEWSELLKAAMAAGIQPAQPEVNAYTSLLYASIMDRFGYLTGGSLVPATALSPTRPAPAAAATAGSAVEDETAETHGQRDRQLMAVWSDLEAALLEVLLPALPCIPDAVLLKQLHKGLLHSSVTPAVLAQSSWRQLSLLCTYGLQTGPELVPAEWWRQLQEEVQQRRLLPEAALDLASICYGLEVHGCQVPEWTLSALRETLGASQMDQWVHNSVVTRGGPRALPLLHLLWMSRQAGFLAAVPQLVWQKVYGGLGPNDTTLTSLMPQQLGQLVLLWSDLMRGTVVNGGRDRSTRSSHGTGSEPSRIRTLPASFTASWLTALVHTCDERELQEPQDDAVVSPLQRPLKPLVAALAICFCLPSSESGSGDSDAVLQQCVVALVDRALPALSSSLPLSDVPTFLEALERRAVRLPQPHLQALVERLAGQAAAAPKEKMEGFLAPGTRNGAWQTELDRLEPVQAIRVVTSLLSAKDVKTVLPVLVALMPGAREAILRQVLKERIEQSVLSSAMEAVVFSAADSNFCASLTAASCAAHVSAVATSSMVQTLLAGLTESRERIKRVPAERSVAAAHMPLHALRPLQQPDGEVTLENIPPAELARLAEALVEAAGSHRLPLPASAVLLRLLSVEDVVHGVPRALLERALRFSLLSPEKASDPWASSDRLVLPLPMPDAVYRALVRQLLPTAGIGMGVSGLLSCLQRCGARPVQFQETLLELRDVRNLTSQEVLGILRVLVYSGVQERQALKQLPQIQEDNLLSIFKTLKGSNRRRAEHVLTQAMSTDASAPYTLLVDQLTWQLASLRNLSIRETAEALRHLAVLTQRLEGLSYDAFWTNVTVIANGFATVQSIKNGLKDPDALLDFLEASFSLGGGRLNTLKLQRVTLAIVLSLQGKLVQTLVGLADSAVAEKNTELMNRMQRQVSLVTEIGSYIIDEVRTGSLQYIIAALMTGHIESTRTEDFVEEDDSDPYLLLVTPNHRRLSARELGLLFGVLMLRNAEASAFMDTTEKVSILATSRRWIPRIYGAELITLAESAVKMTPLESLTAMLDALEPVAVTNPYNEVYPPNVLDMLPPLHVLLSVPLARLMLDDDSSDQPVFEGLDTLDDCFLLYLHNDRIEDSLREAPFLSQSLTAEQATSARAAAAEGSLGSEGRRGPGRAATRAKEKMAVGCSLMLNKSRSFKLPPELRPPPGRRHGMPGEAAGDAAREAYVRAAVPWLMAGSRLLRLVFALELESELREHMRAAGLPLVGKGRWAKAIAAALLLDCFNVNEAEKAFALAQAEAEASAKAAKAAAEAVAATTAGLAGAVSFQGFSGAALAMEMLSASKAGKPGPSLNFLTKDFMREMASIHHGIEDEPHDGGDDSGDNSGEDSSATSWNPFNVISEFQRKLAELRSSIDPEGPSREGPSRN